MEKKLKINERIEAQEVRLVGEDGKQLGIMGLDEALKHSSQAGLDLVEISPHVEPPVCKIMDYGRYSFNLKKKRASSKKKQKNLQVKEMVYRPGIEEADYQVKLRKLSKFLEDGHKIKVVMRFRGREVTHHELGFKVLKRLEADLLDFGTIELSPQFEGRQIILVMSPKKKA